MDLRLAFTLWCVQPGKRGITGSWSHGPGGGGMLLAACRAAGQLAAAVEEGRHLGVESAQACHAGVDSVEALNDMEGGGRADVETSRAANR